MDKVRRSVTLENPNINKPDRQQSRLYIALSTYQNADNLLLDSNLSNEVRKSVRRQLDTLNQVQERLNDLIEDEQYIDI